jgi:two-component system sensor kinase FixL
MSKEIKKNSAKLNAILNTVVDGIITIDSKGIVESLNPSAAGLFGYSPDEVIGNNVSMLMPLPHRINHNQYLDNHLTKGVKNIIGKGREVEGKRKDGTTFPFWLNVEKVKIDDRIIFTGIIHDVSDLRKAEKDLLISEKQLSAIIDTAVDGIIMIDKKGVMEVVNPSAAQMFGYQWSELIGKNVRSLMPEPDHSAHDGYMNNYHQTGIRRIIGIGREVKGKRKDNSIFPFNLSISEVPLPDRTIYVGVIHDISYQKEAQSRIETLNEQLEKKVEERTEKLAEVVNKLLVTNKSLEKQMKATEAAQTALLKSQEELTIALAKEQELNQLKSRFVSTASHEFRTPLSTILSSAALIARYTAEGTEAKRQRHVDKIKSSVKHLNSILNDFLSIAKLEEGKFSHHPSLFDVRVFISDVIEEISGILKPNQTVSVSYKGDAETCLDQQFFKNILINLISNASKYSDDNTNIEVHSENAQNELTIKVTDHGIGIPLTEQVHLFERFFRAQNAINIQGTGLGLNIVKKYVDLMDGNITFISKENEGTTFIVKLPFDS